MKISRREAVCNDIMLISGRAIDDNAIDKLGPKTLSVYHIIETRSNTFIIELDVIDEKLLTDHIFIARRQNKTLTESQLNPDDIRREQSKVCGRICY